MRALSRALAGAAAIAVLATAATTTPAAGAPQRAGEQTYTPVIQEVVSVPRWYRGIDNRVHIEYELRLTNGFPVAATVTEIEVRRGGGATIAELTGDELLAAISPIGEPAATRPRSRPTRQRSPSSTSPCRARLSFRGGSSTRPRSTSSPGSRCRRPASTSAPSPASISGARSGSTRRSAARAGGRSSAPTGALCSRSTAASSTASGSRSTGTGSTSRIGRLSATRPASPATRATGRRCSRSATARWSRPSTGSRISLRTASRRWALEIADGNYVILKLGPGVYAGYAHLIPGSVDGRPRRHGSSRARSSASSATPGTPMARTCTSSS